MAIRTFLAIPLPPPLQQHVAVLQQELAEDLPEVTWTPPANSHLTLRFFGATPADDLEKIRAIVLSIALRQAPFTATLSRLGVFPDVRAPRVLWLGVDSPRLNTLHAACVGAFRQAGFSDEGRRFVPHLTIGRLHRRPPRLSQVLAGWTERQPELLPVDRLILYESQLLPGGARHLPLLTAPLGNGPGAID
jgi:2'-5' RNA ligase